MYPYYYEPRTLKGLKLINIGWLLYIIALIILLIMLIAMIPFIMEAFNNPEDVDPSDFGVFIGIITSICLSGLFFLIVAILFLIGIIHLVSGREEFGLQHSNRVLLGFILIIIGFILPVFSYLTSTYSGTIYLRSGLSIASSFLMALGFVFLVENLLDDRWKKILWAGGMIYIIFSIIASSILTWFFLSVGSNLDAPGEPFFTDVTALMAIASGLMAMNLLPIFIFFLCYRQAEHRIRTGELKLVQPPYPPPPPYYYPPAPPVYYPPPAYGYGYGYGYPPPSYGYP
ncbi:MAG: hypothetical protein KAJ51_04010, partial [Thermoplasmata archaeon]|nr:hypothetical protein [Thermoplasmata archaeon]